MAYELHGWGSDLAIEVSGPDVVSCCAAAVEGFAASFVEPVPDAERRTVEVDLQGDDPGELLAELLEEAVARVDARGEVAVGFSGGSVAGGGLTGRLVVVPLDAVELTGAVPKAVTWHDRRLEPTGQGWSGHVVLDL